MMNFKKIKSISLLLMGLLTLTSTFSVLAAGNHGGGRGAGFHGGAGYHGGYRGGYYGGGGWGLGLGLVTGAVIGAELAAPYYPYYYPDPAVTLPPSEYIQAPIQVAPSNNATPLTSAPVWYYCASSKTYYPYTNACPEGWQIVPVTPPQPPQ